MEEVVKRILQAREERWRRRCDLAGRHMLPVVSITMNIPGPDKMKTSCSQAHQVIVEAFLAALAEEEKGIVFRETRTGWDGCETLLVVEGDAENLKRLAMGVEESHPLGRLADIDVMDGNKRVLRRKDLQAPERCCLVCGGPARSCILERKHPLAVVRDAAEKLLNGPQRYDYRASSGDSAPLKH